MSSLTLSKIVGSTKKPLLADALAAGHERGALLLAQLDVVEDLVELLLRDLRPLLGLGVERVADLAAPWPSRPAVRRTPRGSSPRRRAGCRPCSTGRRGSRWRGRRRRRPASRSASAKMTLGLLPPSSKVRPLERVGRGLLDDLGRVDVAGEGDLVDVRVDDHGGAGGLAQAVDDVDHARRESRPRAPARRPAGAVSGVCSAGFITIVLPQARAGPHFQASISSGKFQGMIWPTTPTGCRRV